MTIIEIRPRTLLRWRLRLACYTTGDRMAAHRKFNGTLDFSGTASTFVGLSVKRFPQIHDNVGANTRLSIAGLGTLWLHRVIHRPNSIEIRMIELIVTESNTFGIPIGTDVQVAVAEASVH